jgi:hypothetical protein
MVERLRKVKAEIAVKAAPARAKVYAAVDGLVCRQAKLTSICTNMSAYSVTVV